MASRYLLDASMCVALMAQNETARTALDRVPSHELAISSIILFELEYGIHRSRHKRSNAARLDTFLANIGEVLPFDEQDAKCGAQIRVELESRKQPMGHYDTLIAGQALARGLTLVTVNEREFRRVKGLRWENWAKA